MNFIRTLGFVPYWAAATWLYRRQNLVEGAGYRTRALLADGALDPALDNAVPISNLIARARRVAEGMNLVLAGADLVWLDAGADVAWRQGDDAIAAHVGIVTNPGSMLYSGNESALVLPGQVVAISTKPLWSMINAGETPFVTLRLMLESPPAAA